MGDQRKVGGQVETVRMHQGPWFCEQRLESCAVRGRLVGKVSVDAVAQQARRVIPEPAKSVVLLRDGKGFNPGELRQRADALRNRGGGAPGEAECRDVEGLSQFPQDVKCPDLDAAIGWIGQCLGEEEQPRPVSQSARPPGRNR